MVATKVGGYNKLHFKIHEFLFQYCNCQLRHSLKSKKCVIHVLKNIMVKPMKCNHDDEMYLLYDIS